MEMDENFDPVEDVEFVTMLKEMFPSIAKDEAAATTEIRKDQGKYWKDRHDKQTLLNSTEASFDEHDKACFSEKGEKAILLKNVISLFTANF